jgi:hypothetical protein
MRLRTMAVAFVLALAVMAVAVAAAADAFKVEPNEFDPGHTFLVQAAWLGGIGCPTNAKIANPNADSTGVASIGTYTDPACQSGDPADKQNEGLLLAKTGPTNNFASAFARIDDPPATITQLGYDIRKPTSPGDPRGSHCGAGAPRFNVTTGSTTSFVGCNSPAPTVAAVGNGWLRLRWTVNYTGVSKLSIVFDEGQDTGPDNFGLAVLDNVDVNGTLVGQGAAEANAAPGPGHNGDVGPKGKAFGQKKITICHKPGTKAEKTITVPEPAVKSHLAHGDHLGAC